MVALTSQVVMKHCLQKLLYKEAPMKAEPQDD